MKEEFNFEEFEKSSYFDWLSKVQQDLGKEKAEKIQTWQPERVLKVSVYHDSESTESSVLPLNGRGDNGWQYIQPLGNGSDSQLNREILDALMNGAGGFIVKAFAGCNYAELLKGVKPDHCQIFVEYTDDISMRDLQAWFTRSVDTGSASLVLLNQVDEIRLKTCLKSTLPCLDKFNGHRCLELDSHRIVNKGGSVQTEIAYILSKCVYFINSNLDEGRSLVEISSSMFVNTAIGSSYFLELVKINVIRQLLGKIYSNFGLDEVNLRIHASTASITKSALDSNTNFLRCTSEAMSAILGGVDSLSITVQHDLSFSDRVARNISNLLSEESYLGKVGNVSDGSYYLETLSNDLAASAWNIFQSLSSAGGYKPAIERGLFLDAIEKDLTFKSELIESGKSKLVGVNDFGNQDELLYPKNFDFSKSSFSAKFEKIRHTVEKHVKNNGNRPKLYLAAIGVDGKMINARQSFVTNFFSWAGFKIANLSQDIELNDTAVVVWCGSDDSFALLKQLQDEKCISNDTLQIVAGNLDDEHRTGIHTCVNMKSNRLQVVSDILGEMNIKLDDHE